ncbi:MAG: hypothetical protein WC872_04505 [Candidatus Absconditabacterales bacterium]
MIVSYSNEKEQLENKAEKLEAEIEQIKAKEIKVFEAYNGNWQNIIEEEEEEEEEYEDKDIRRMFYEKITIVSFSVGKDSVMILYPVAKMSVLPWEKDEKSIWIMKIPIKDYRRNINSIVQYSFNGSKSIIKRLGFLSAFF